MENALRYTDDATPMSLAAWRDAERAEPGAHPPWQTLAPHVAWSVAPLAVVNALWGLLVARGAVDAGPTRVGR